MRDFHWRRRHQQVGGIEDVYRPTANHALPDQLKGRFRLNRATAKPVATPLRKKQSIPAGKDRVNRGRLVNEYHTIYEAYPRNSTASAALHPNTWLDGKYDPFNVFNLLLEGDTLKLVDYCKYAYLVSCKKLYLNSSGMLDTRSARLSIKHSGVGRCGIRLPPFTACGECQVSRAVEPCRVRLYYSVWPHKPRRFAITAGCKGVPTSKPTHLRRGLQRCDYRSRCFDCNEGGECGFAYLFSI